MSPDGSVRAVTRKVRKKGCGRCSRGLNRMFVLTDEKVLEFSVNAGAWVDSLTLLTGYSTDSRSGSSPRKTKTSENLSFGHDN